MKKTLLLTVSILLLLALAAVGIGLYITGTPEYALKEIAEDVQASGMDGLYPHLTGEARETVDTILSVTEDPLLSSILGLIGQSEYLENLKAGIKEIQWGVRDILKSNEQAAVILTFNYPDKFSGTIELSMIKEEGQWKISGLEFPEFDK